MRGWRSRKFLQAAAAQFALTVALGYALRVPALYPYLPYLIAGIVAVAVGYGAANAWQARATFKTPPDI